MKAMMTAAALALLSQLAQAAPDAQQILAASDAVRNPGKPFGVMVSLVGYKDGKENERNSLAVYSRADASSGQYRSLIRFVSPARDAGKLMLKNGNDLWFYDPASKASVPISPQQRLLGQASNGDVMTVNLALDYAAKLEGEEDIQDGDRQTRRCYKLKLAARNGSVTYHAIELWLDVNGYRSRKARFYSESGSLLKTAYYRGYQQVLGQERPTETVIIDGLNPKWVTVMRNSDFAWREVPEAWLQRDYLPRFRAE
ncbi:outer membrane lipoprotein-sorting protein [Chromobacterium sp. IIBBL 290-4]|uniref:outer membrane lipoprotein-sorting protein n=1 Tax=Chromobacterium sp. IIBBL 290-4 TaxID=2953890 RepID=UPI0020B68525|nr:outer membrane lipoprotein-sorting protein [Chromobacterium sp. IIBBL 290-4]UTH72884.1 outer membrane lipoprotein-sorting protein [Chromobacterium sp. IIBBL 290-4]